MDRLASLLRSTAAPALRSLGRYVRQRPALSVMLIASLPLAFDIAGRLQSLGTIATTAFGLGMVIFLHELGHFAAAKWCGVKVEQFAIGFGGPIVSKQVGETLYAIRWLPLGGYVKMYGQDDMDSGEMTDETIAADPRSYPAQSVPERMLIISAGVIMNLITGTLFFVTALGMGVTKVEPVAGHIQLGSAAWRRGLEVGDRILSINGEEIESFSDIIRGTALSRGELDLVVQPRDGDYYTLRATPEETGRRRRLGMGSMLGLVVAGSDKLPPAIAGQPAEGVGFQPGDHIVGVDGVVVDDYVDFMAALEDRRDQTAAVTVARMVTDESTGRTEQKNVTLELPPHRRRDFGFRVDVEPIDTLVDGSVAADEGIAVGDRLAKVDGRAVGVDIDPLDLPRYFVEKAGQPVVVTIVRETDGRQQEFDKTVTPSDSREWMYPPTERGSALAIASLGVTMPLVPTILRLDDELAAGGTDRADISEDSSEGDGEAERSEAADANASSADAEQPQRPSRGSKLISVSVPASGNAADGLGGKAKTYDIINDGWPFVSHQLSLLPPVELTLTWEDAETGETHQTALPPRFDGYVDGPRGLRLYSATMPQKAGSIGEAFSMGLDQAYSSVTDIYLTLSSLKIFGGSLSFLEFAGPVQIANIGYEVAKSGLSDFLIFLGFLSVNLAVVNFLPIPVLDGGHMILLIYEGLTGKKPSAKATRIWTNVGAALIISLMLFVIGLDVLKLFGFFAE